MFQKNNTVCHESVQLGLYLSACRAPACFSTQLRHHTSSLSCLVLSRTFSHSLICHLTLIPQVVLFITPVYLFHYINPSHPYLQSPSFRVLKDSDPIWFSSLTLLFNVVLEVLTRGTWKTIRNRKNAIQIGKEEIKLSLFAYSTTAYEENPIESTRKRLELSEFSNLQDTMPNAYMKVNHTFVYKQWTIRNWKLKITLFKIATKKMKYLEKLSKRYLKHTQKNAKHCWKK